MDTPYGELHPSLSKHWIIYTNDTVDGSNLLHRDYTLPADLRDSKGNYTGGLHSFLNSLSTAH